MISGELYNAASRELCKERDKARELCFKLNSIPLFDENKEKICKELLGKVGSNILIESPFHCDYGYNINLGDNVCINFNCCILDCTQVTIGHNVKIGPNVQIYTATHPVDPQIRLDGLEYAKEIVIADNVWIGGGSILNPGITIGKNSVIGSGSVVTKDIPCDVIAAGNPCKVIRNIVN